MLIRALIVLLIVLNLGVAAWWLSGPAQQPLREPPVKPSGVPRLELVEQPRPSVAAAVSSPDAPGARSPGVATDSGVASDSPPACFSLGPFAAEAAADRAKERLRNVVAESRTRVAPATGASAYNVFLPPAADRAQAQAAAERIGAAGFDDFLVVNTGEMANSVALGRYGSLEVAQRRQASLQAAGFAAQVGAVGATMPAQWWLDARAPAEFTPQHARALVGAAQSQALDCGLLL